MAVWSTTAELELQPHATALAACDIASFGPSAHVQVTAQSGLHSPAMLRQSRRPKWLAADAVKAAAMS